MEIQVSDAGETHNSAKRARRRQRHAFQNMSLKAENKKLQSDLTNARLQLAAYRIGDGDGTAAAAAAAAAEEVVVEEEEEAEFLIVDNDNNNNDDDENNKPAWLYQMRLVLAVLNFGSCVFIGVTATVTNVWDVYMFNAIVFTPGDDLVVFGRMNHLVVALVGTPFFLSFVMFTCSIQFPSAYDAIMQKRFNSWRWICAITSIPLLTCAAAISVGMHEITALLFITITTVVVQMLLALDEYMATRINTAVLIQRRWRGQHHQQHNRHDRLVRICVASIAVVLALIVSAVIAGFGFGFGLSNRIATVWSGIVFDVVSSVLQLMMIIGYHCDYMQTQNYQRYDIVYSFLEFWVRVLFVLSFCLFVLDA